MEKYLPIGSVCTLKGKNKKVMVTGFYSMEFNGNLKMKDYSGCAFPEGFLLPEMICSFNHDDIEKVDFVGFKNTEYTNFIDLLKEKNTKDFVSKSEENIEINNSDNWILTSNKNYSKLLFDENGVVVLAEPIKQDDSIESYSFDENGVVTIDNSVITNPFYKSYLDDNFSDNETSYQQNDLKIFDSIEFDENGIVVGVNNNKESASSSLSEFKFDENGVVIDVNGETLKEQKDYSEYQFDENGVVIDVNGETLKEQKDYSEYQFDENGVVIDINGESSKEEKNYNKYQFDENGILIAINEKDELTSSIDLGLSDNNIQQPAVESIGYQFDENGIVVEVN